MRAASVALAIVGILWLSGCIGSANPSSGQTATGVPSEAPRPEFDSTTGALTGTVTSDELAPITGAQVALIDAPAFATLTDPGGRFTLSSLPPGKHSLGVGALGFESVARSVEVVAGEAVDLHLSLSPIPVPVAYPQLHRFTGYIDCAVAYIRSVIQHPVTCNSGQPTVFYDDVFKAKDGWPVDFKGVTVEADWKTQDYLGFDFNDRDIGYYGVYARVRQQSPVHFFLERCGNYTATFGRHAMPCTDDEVKASHMHIETWYVGQYQTETHNLDAACKDSAPVYWPGYQQGCYGLGVATDLKWNNYITIFHVGLPDNFATFSNRPEG